MNGAVGNFNAHYIAYPDKDWPAFAQDVITNKLNLEYNKYTIQIEPHDYMAQLFDAIVCANTILIDLDRDIWGLYLLELLQTAVKKKAKSVPPTMPRIRSIRLTSENSEGNLGMANAFLTFLAQKLPISRWRRDLTDSTVLRNMGVSFGLLRCRLHTAHNKRCKAKLQLNEQKAVSADLDNSWEVLAEAIQTVMRALWSSPSIRTAQGIDQRQRHYTGILA